MLKFISCNKTLQNQSEKKTLEFRKMLLHYSFWIRSNLFMYVVVLKQIQNYQCKHFEKKKISLLRSLY